MQTAIGLCLPAISTHHWHHICTLLGTLPGTLLKHASKRRPNGDQSSTTHESARHQKSRFTTTISFGCSKQQNVNSYATAKTNHPSLISACNSSISAPGTLVVHGLNFPDAQAQAQPDSQPHAEPINTDTDLNLHSLQTTTPPSPSQPTAPNTVLAAAALRVRITSDKEWAAALRRASTWAALTGEAKLAIHAVACIATLARDPACAEGLRRWPLSYGFQLANRSIQDSARVVSSAPLGLTGQGLMIVEFCTEFPSRSFVPHSLVSMAVLAVPDDLNQSSLEGLIKKLGIC